MAQYLTDDEILKYCQVQAGVNVADVIIASELIDSYVGKSFSIKDASESVKVNAKRRGKLNHSPIISITEVKEVVVTPIGVTKQDVPASLLVMDIEDDGYFTYIAHISPFACPMSYCMRGTNEINRKLEVKYQYGYETIPEDIKMVTAMLAQNIRQLQTFAGITKLTTLDYTVAMSNPSFFTDDMRLILNKYR
jgi:hypothetical protein